ncbi:MAG TPA: biotin/lipoyl-containing protein, partial [Streptosporangiaceae bacterium]
NLPSQPRRKSYRGPFGDVEVAYRPTRDGVRVDGHPNVRHLGTTRTGPPAPGGYDVALEVEGVRRIFSVRAVGPDVFVDSGLGPVALRAVPRFADPEDLVAPGSLLAPMPGTVVRVLAERGAAVTAGRPLVVIEAMKMEHRIAAPATGVLVELNVAAGQQVAAGAVLAVIAEPTAGRGGPPGTGIAPPA